MMRWRYDAQQVGFGTDAARGRRKPQAGAAPPGQSMIIFGWWKLGWYCTVLSVRVLNCIALYGIALYCLVLPFLVLSCILYSIAFYRCLVLHRLVRSIVLIVPWRGLAAVRP
jgi:hypothetical protein